MNEVSQLIGNPKWFKKRKYTGRGIEPTQFRELVIRPTLKHLGVYTKATEELLFATAAHESLGGRIMKQFEGPALGPYQVEPFTHQDHWSHYLKYRPELAAKIKQLTRYPRSDSELITNLKYATAMAYIKYERMQEPIPTTTDIHVLAKYWKKHYNTHLGAGTVKQFVRDYYLWK